MLAFKIKKNKNKVKKNKMQSRGPQKKNDDHRYVELTRVGLSTL